MSGKIAKKEGANIEIEFVVSKEDFNVAIDAAYKKIGKDFKIPGFRNGKVPKDVIEKTYGEAVFYDEAFNIVASEEYVKFLEESKLDVVSRPEVINIDQIEKNKDLTFKLGVSVKPEVEIKGYKEITVSVKAAKVAKEDIDKELESMKEKNARIIPKDSGSVAKGDTANINFEGFKDSVPFEGGKGENYDLEIGSNSFIPGFEDQLIGMKKDEEKEITVTFPKEYGNADLAGKETMFKVKINDIKEKKLPEINDEFAKDFSEFETLEDLKKDLKVKLEKKAEDKFKMDKEQAILDKIVELVKVDIPEAMINTKIDTMLQEFEQNLAQQSITIDKYLEILNTTIDDIKKQFRESAIKDIKLNLAIEFIQNKENITVEENEINEKIEELIKTYGKEKDAEDFKSNPNVHEYLTNQIKQEKTVALLLDNAKTK